MKNQCDLYLCNPVEASRLRMLRLFDKGFSCESGKILEGYLFVSVSRVKLVAVVSALRREVISCFSVPIEYRNVAISVESAYEMARKYVRKLGGDVIVRDQSQFPPLFWSFSCIPGNDPEKKTGGVVMIDRLDGHVWSMEEYEEYMYDYNNIF